MRIVANPQPPFAGRYRLERQLGAGGAARVWLAFDSVLERRVAIKILEPGDTDDEAHRRRFRQEARAVARLQHPHIVGVLDIGADEHTQFIVLEFVDGETLKERIRRVGRLTIPEAIAFTVEVARALDAAHRHGLVHRDIKPQNILLDAEGGAKLTDFGIARAHGDDGLTLGGRVLGTADYVSPEQALGRDVDARSDIYSLGVVLYECLTGSVPFSAPTQIAVAAMHVRDEIPDVQQRRPEVSAALAAVLERATARSAADRHQSAAELIADLEDALALEAARGGTAAGEAGAVLRSLPGERSARVPMRVRHPLRVRAVALLALALVGGAIAFAVIRIERGTAPPQTAAGGGEVTVSLAQGAATPYNPFGTAPEDPAAAPLAIDGDPGTGWTTSVYLDGRMYKSGVGLYVDAAPGVRANRATLITTTPGFAVQVWGAERVAPVVYHDTTQPGTPADLGWRLLGGDPSVGRTSTIPLRGGHRWRYYLLWITGLGPDPSGAPRSVEVNEFQLERPQAR